MRTITALTTSPHCGSGMPSTTTSAISGWSPRQRSTSLGKMFSPPEMIIDLIRSTM